MIATLRGSLRLRETGRIVVETGGVGYELFIPLSTSYRLPAAGAVVELEVRQLVREGVVALYRFASRAEKQAFDLLTRVQHVGLKLALAVLSVMSPEEMAAAIVHGDIDCLDAVPGVGRKVAERVVRELSDRVAELNSRRLNLARVRRIVVRWCSTTPCRRWSISATNGPRRSLRSIPSTSLPPPRESRPSSAGHWWYCSVRSKTRNLL
jgi:Holliday junction DNA helicase RuvA subunit